ncbi:hypothetical protein LTR36_009281 [Oleoguttula mirabilis]|uniref:Uncharacterized protein n=1 Tax=Oleoguttula mirabilis TaxID=1507867 RepID=A0AAV9J5V9_9PEZI|nr:hypothetical protein LTR36_009281 [Oleoguttula mirabilis]
MAECQAQWSTFIAGDEVPYDNTVSRPKCTQASITGKECDSLVAAYYFTETMYGDVTNPGYVHTNGSSYWPSTMTFAPGCTLGCQTCAITGATVQLYYWPAATDKAVINGTATAIPAMNSVNASGPVVANVNGTLLTSPTVYVSYDKLYAANSCHGLGRTYYNTIVGLTNTHDLSSMEYREVDDLGWYYTTLSFDFKDLVEPVPDSIYNKMPRCVESSLAYYGEGLGETAPFTCPRDGPYAPIIAVPKEIQQLDPAWKSCTAYYGGLYDPPKALQPVTTAAGVSAQAGGATTTATPGQTVSDPAATKTATTTQQSVTVASPIGYSSPLPVSIQASSEAPPPDLSTTAQSSDPADATSVDQTSADPTSSPATSPTTENASQLSSGGADSADPAVSSNHVTTAGATTSSSLGPVAASGADPSTTEPALSSSAAINPLLSVIGDIGATSNSAPESQPAASQVSSAQASGGSATDADPLISAIGQAAANPDAETSTQPVSTGQSIVDDSQNSSDPDEVPQTAASPVVATIGSDGAVVTASVLDGSIAVAISGSSTVLATGQVATVAGHYVSIASYGVHIDSSAIVTLLSPSTSNIGADAQSTRVAATGSDGEVVLVGQVDGSLVVQGVSSTVTLAPGQGTFIAGQEVSAALSGGGIVVDGSRTVQLGSSSATPLPGAVFTGAQGQTIGVSGVDGGLQLADGSSTATLKAGDTTVYVGRTISAAQSGSYAVVDGSSTVLADTEVTAASAIKVTITGDQGQSMQLSYDDGGDVVVADGTSSITLQAGHATTFDGKTLSAAQSASYVVVDGSSTVLIHAADSTVPSTGAFITGAQGQDVQVSADDGKLDVGDGTSTVTIDGGQARTFDGRTISAAAGGSYAVIDGSSTISFGLGSTLSAADSAITGTGGQTIGLSADGGEVLLDQGSSTVTLEAGQVTTADGRTISEGSAGGYAVIDGSSTISLSAPSASSTRAPSTTIQSRTSGALVTAPSSTGVGSALSSASCRRTSIGLRVVAIAALMLSVS